MVHKKHIIPFFYDSKNSKYVHLLVGFMSYQVGRYIPAILPDTCQKEIKHNKTSYSCCQENTSTL